MNLLVWGWLVGVLMGLFVIKAPMATPSRPVYSGSAARYANAASGQYAPPELLTRLPVGAGDRVFEFHGSDRGGEATGLAFESGPNVNAASSRLVEYVYLEPNEELEIPGMPGSRFRVEYALDSRLNRQIFQVLAAAKVERGHVIVLDPGTGRVLAYASTDPQGFPPARAYPAASIIKVVTAAAILEHAPFAAERPCRYSGSPYSLERFQIYSPPEGKEVSFTKALATSNNQCFAQLAVLHLGGQGMLDAIDRFGLLEAAGPGHARGVADPVKNDYDLGRLGSGLAGSHITPLHAARLIATLANGEQVEPWWVERVLDSSGRELLLPQHSAKRQVMSPASAAELREMMVDTTVIGTARRAFRNAEGDPRLGSIRVAGKTGNLSGKNPSGRYEWFIGLAPAEAPTIALVVVQVHRNRSPKKSSEIAVDVLAKVFCSAGNCQPHRAMRYTGTL